MVKRKANREIYVNKTSTVLHYVPIRTSKWMLGVEGEQGKHKRSIP